jgi:hypothetical protein
VLYSQLSYLPRPHSADLKTLQEWMRRPSMGKVFLLGRGRNIWHDGQDLVALKSRTSSNKFSAWIVDTLTPLFHYFIGKPFKVS